MLQREIQQYAEISVFGPKYGRILRGGSKVPHRWFIETNEPKKFFFTSNFQPLPEITSY